MFLTTRKIPLIALKCEALIRNLPLDYPKLTEINSVHSKLMAGYYGDGNVPCATTNQKLLTNKNCWIIF